MLMTAVFIILYKCYRLSHFFQIKNHDDFNIYFPYSKNTQYVKITHNANCIKYSFIIFNTQEVFFVPVAKNSYLFSVRFWCATGSVFLSLHIHTYCVFIRFFHSRFTYTFSFMDIVCYLRINHPENRQGIFSRTIFTGTYGHKEFIVGPLFTV